MREKLTELIIAVCGQNEDPQLDQVTILGEVINRVCNKFEHSEQEAEINSALETLTKHQATGDGKNLHGSGDEIAHARVRIADALFLSTVEHPSLLTLLNSEFGQTLSDAFEGDTPQAPITPNGKTGINTREM